VHTDTRVHMHMHMYSMHMWQKKEEKETANFFLSNPLGLIGESKPLVAPECCTPRPHRPPFTFRFLSHLPRRTALTNSRPLHA